MSNGNLSTPYKERFKGIENFLRRVAFNLGNTASQTEVKIISCIPIDVTDLQQKIVNLERQLHEAKQRRAETGQQGVCGAAGGSTPATVANAASNETSFVKPSSTVSSSSDGLKKKSLQVATHCCDCTSRHRSSVIFLAQSTPKAEQSCSFNSHESINLDNGKTSSTAPERYMNIFKKRMRTRIGKGKSKTKTHLIYFEQHAQNNPFHTNERHLNSYDLNDNTEIVSQTYLSNIIRRQYDPELVVQEFSDTSDFSRPICRDTRERNTCSRHESDICSCCHGRFQNIDNYMTKTFDPINKLENYDNREIATKLYYDSNLYDVVPVKEKSNIFRNDILPKTNVDIKCWPERYRSKCRYNPIIHNQTEIQQDQIVPPRNKNIYKTNLEPSRGKQKSIDKHNECTGIETSKSFYIDCGDIYKKPLATLQKSEPVKTVLFKNQLVETDNTNTQLNHQSTQLEPIPDNNKTELTLNQIKTILQSVLAEVKTSTKVNRAPKKEENKDAVAQKGPSQTNTPGNSTTLHSFTYDNPYNTNPHLPSCSRQVAPGQSHFASVPYQSRAKHLQNFPVFIHPPSGRQVCACYCRNDWNNCSSDKQVTTAAATNTDKEIQRSSSKETEKLIKEIYKSITLNMDFPTKDNSACGYDGLKSSEISSDNSTKGVKSIGTKVQDRRDVEIDAVMSPDTSNNSELEHTAASTLSKGNGSANEPCFYDISVAQDTSHDEQLHRFAQHNADINIEDEETDSSSSETENFDKANANECNTLSINKKKGIFKRMFQVFRKRRKESSESSDSEDYETIYSDRTGASPPIVPRQDYEDKIYPNVKYLQHSVTNKRGRMSSNLEEEYRRQWNERMMYDKEQGRKYSSERPFSEQSISRTHRPVYCNDYEARSAIVEHDVPADFKFHHSSNKIQQSPTR